jgi:hypothetical protein
MSQNQDGKPQCESRIVCADWVRAGARPAQEGNDRKLRELRYVKQRTVENDEGVSK